MLTQSNNPHFETITSTLENALFIDGARYRYAKDVAIR